MHQKRGLKGGGRVEKGLLARAMRLCAGNVAVRALGFGMRVWLARAVPERTMGMYEMSAQLGMLLLSPLVGGLPQAASRATAQNLARGDEAGAETALSAARNLAGAGAALICLIGAPLMPLVAGAMGERQIVAPFLMMLPSILPLALCAVYYGGMYARASTLPAMLQLIEQSARLVCAFVLIKALGGRQPVLDASLLAMAQTLGALTALVFTRGAARRSGLKSPTPARREYVDMFTAAWPISLSRMCASGLRGACQLILPGRLARAGLSGGSALGEYGVMSGMALPTVFLPFMFTGPLATLALPRIAAARSPAQAGRIARRALLLSGAAGAGAFAIMYMAGPAIGAYIFNNARAGELIRFLAPLAPLGALTQTLNALLQGINKERKALGATLAGALASALLTFILSARPSLGIRGFGLALMMGQGVALIVQLPLLLIELNAPKGAPTNASD